MNNHQSKQQQTLDALIASREGLKYLMTIFDSLNSLHLDEIDKHENIRMTASKAHDLVRVGVYLSNVFHNAADCDVESLQAGVE